jgi:hypothetical protein
MLHAQPQDQLSEFLLVPECHVQDCILQTCSRQGVVGTVINTARFEVLTVVLLMVLVFWDGTLG